MHVLKCVDSTIGLCLSKEHSQGTFCLAHCALTSHQGVRCVFHHMRSMSWPRAITPESVNLICAIAAILRL